jgi:hypothetical protein
MNSDTNDAELLLDSSRSEGATFRVEATLNQNQDLMNRYSREDYSVAAAWIHQGAAGRDSFPKRAFSLLLF